MACRYTYKGKTYELSAFDDLLRAMPPSEAAAFMPTVQSVPDSPFTKSTDAWVALALKRVIKLAVDDGYDRVAFVNGEQSANRYPEALMKAVKRMEWNTRSGQKQVTITPTDGEAFDLVLDDKGIIGRTSNTPADLVGKSFEDAVGKDVAKRVMDDPNDGELSGEGFRIGGAGMRAFYDKIVPSVTKDVLRKLGGGAMETVDIGPTAADNAAKVVKTNPSTWQVQNETGEWLTHDGVWGKSVIDAIEYGSAAAAEAARKQYTLTLTQPGFTITDKLRESAAGGLPLFTRETASPARATASDITRVTNTAEAIASAWANAPEVVVFGDMQDDAVPGSVRARDAQQRSQGATGEPRAFYAGGKVYLHAGMLQTPMDVAEALYHEALGHTGLRGHFGPGLDKVLDLMAAAYDKNVLRAKAKEYGLDLSNQSQRRQVAEEVLAELAQSRPTSTWVQRAVAAIRSFLREYVPGFADLKLTDAEVIRSFILPARGFIERGRTDARGDVAFSRYVYSTAPSGSPGGVPDNVAPSTKAEIAAAKAAIARIEAAGGVTSADDLAAVLRVRGYSQWAESPLARGVESATALRAELAERFPGYGQGLPRLNGKGVVTVSGSWVRAGARNAEEGSLSALTELADKYDAPIIVRGYLSSDIAEVWDIQKRYLEPAGFETYGGMQEFMGANPREIGIHYIRPGGGISRVTPMFSRTPDQTKTEAFRKWFGDSKVVERAYHITRGNFSTFIPGGLDPKLSGKAMWFTNDPNRQPANHNVGAREGFREGTNVMPVFLKMERPLVIDDKTSLDWAREVFANGSREFPQLMADKWVREVTKDGEYDGIIFDGPALGWKDSVREFIVFKPEQIKSATGNSGAFDAGNPDIRFSRAPTAGDLWDVVKSANTPAKARATFLSATENINRFNLWDKTIGTQLNMARKNRHFARVFEAFQQQQDDTAAFAIEAEAEAVDVLARMSGAKEIKDSLKATFSGERSADLQAVSKAIFSNIEGERGVKQKVFTDAELRDDFSLNERQIGQYRQARAAIDQSLDRYAQSLVVRIAQKFVGTEDFRRAGLDETADELLGRLNFRRDQFVEARDSDPINGAIEFDSLTPAERVELTYASATKLLNDKIEALDAAIEQIPGIQKTANDLKAAGYAPAMRFGDYAVTATNPDGTVEFFAMVDNKMQANLLRMRLRQELPGTNVTANAVDKESFKIFGGMSPDTVELFAKFLEVDKTDAFKEFVALAASSRSALKHMLERKGIAGFSQNLPQVLAAFITSNSRAAARNLNGEEIADAMESVKKNANGDVSEQAAKLHQYMQNPADDGAKIRGFMFAYFLGGSVASALVNLTQPLMMTAPYLHQFAGNKIAGIMARAGKIAATGETSNGALKSAMVKAAAEGVTDTHEYYQMMQEAGGSGNVPVRAFMKAWGAMFGAAEVFNRKITFAAAYEVAQGMTEAQLKATGASDAYHFAKRAVDVTQGVHARHNRPVWARGTAGALLMTFKQFSIAYVEFFMRLPTQQKMVALALLVLMAGAEGLPFAEDLEDLIDTLGQKMGYGTNTKKALRQAATAMLGDAGAQFALHGITGVSGLPMDISGRLGMGNLIPGTKLFNPSVRDKSREVLDIAGPAGGMAKKALEAVDTADPTRAFPSAMANAAKALQMFETGQYRDTANKRVQDVDGMDATMKLIGFQPQSVAAGSRRMAEDMRDVDTVRRVEAEIVAQWAEGMRSRDQEAIKDARERLKDWNADNPDLPIKIKMSQVVAKVKALSSTRDQRFMKSAPPEMRRKLMAEAE